MSCTQLILDEALASPRTLSPEECVRGLRLAAAIHWYRHCLVSLEKAAQIAGLGQAGFVEALCSNRDHSLDQQDSSARIRKES